MALCYQPNGLTASVKSDSGTPSQFQLTPF